MGKKKGKRVTRSDIIRAVAELAERTDILEMRLDAAAAGIIPRTGEVPAGPLPDGPGAVFDKHALTAGVSFPDPRDGKFRTKSGTITVSVKDLDRMVANFRRKVTGPVPVQLAGRDGEHTDDPLRGAGEVIGVRREGKKLITRLDVRDPGTADRIRRRLILGSSVYLSLDDKHHPRYLAGTRGPVILHQVLCQRSWLTDLDPFTEVAAEAITPAMATAEIEALAFRNGVLHRRVAALEAEVAELERERAGLLAAQVTVTP
jgi:hypothetical protein